VLGEYQGWSENWLGIQVGSHWENYYISLKLIFDPHGFIMVKIDFGDLTPLFKFQKRIPWQGIK